MEDSKRKRRAYDFITAEKEAGIQKDNKKLLDRLIEISAGRSAVWKTMLPKIESRTQPKSLNYLKRKNHVLQIEKENLALARRLVQR